MVDRWPHDGVASGPLWRGSRRRGTAPSTGTAPPEGGVAIVAGRAGR